MEAGAQEKVGELLGGRRHFHLLGSRSLRRDQDPVQHPDCLRMGWPWHPSLEELRMTCPSCDLRPLPGLLPGRSCRDRLI